MKKKIIILFVLVSVITVYALSNSFSLDTTKLSFSSGNKKEDIISNFNKNYALSYTVTEDKEKEKEELKQIAKKTTYLLFGDFNNTNESSEHFYNRKMEFYSSRYNVTPSDNYSNVADFAIPQVFNQAVEIGLQYNSFGEIRVEFVNDMAIVTVSLPRVKVKEQSKTDPMKYDFFECDYTLYYGYHKQGNEWRLWYLYGEGSDEVASYVNSIESLEYSHMAVAPIYESQLSSAYSFKKINSMKQEEIDAIYKANKNNIVYLTGIYNNIVVSNANGFFISDGLVVTTWDFLEKTLINAQYFTIVCNGEAYSVDGIVTINPNSDIAVIKVEKKNKSFVKIGDYKLLKVEDPAIVISSKYGTGSVLQKGIVVSSNKYIQSSIPLSSTDVGSPLLNSKGEVVGINTSKSLNASISIAINSDALKEVQDKFKGIDYEKIETVSFDDLKSKFYYINYSDEIIYNSIPNDKWDEYSKIGNIKEKISLGIVKASYKNGVVSLRYQNNIANFVNSMQFAGEFKEQLIADGYKEISNGEFKSVYQNNKYKVIIMEEFDYLIIVMVKI